MGDPVPPEIELKIVVSICQGERAEEWLDFSGRSVPGQDKDPKSGVKWCPRSGSAKYKGLKE